MQIGNFFVIFLALIWFSLAWKSLRPKRWNRICSTAWTNLISRTCSCRFWRWVYFFYNVYAAFLFLQCLCFLPCFPFFTMFMLFARIVGWHKWAFPNPITLISFDKTKLKLLDLGMLIHAILQCGPCETFSWYFNDPVRNYLFILKQNLFQKAKFKDGALTCATALRQLPKVMPRVTDLKIVIKLWQGPCELAETAAELPDLKKLRVIIQERNSMTREQMREAERLKRGLKRALGRLTERGISGYLRRKKKGKVLEQFEFE